MSDNSFKELAGDPPTFDEFLNEMDEEIEDEIASVDSDSLTVEQVFDLLLNEIERLHLVLAAHRTILAGLLSDLSDMNDGRAALLKDAFEMQIENALGEEEAEPFVDEFDLTFETAGLSFEILDDLNNLDLDYEPQS